MRHRKCLVVAVLTASAFAAEAGSPKLQTSPESTKLYELSAREAQFQAVSAMPQVDVEYGAYGRIRRIEGHSGIVVSNTAQLKQGEKATGLLHRMKALLMASSSESLVVKVSGREPTGNGMFFFTEQMIDDIPVIDARVNVVVGADGEIQTINSLFVPRGSAPGKPQISARDAKAKLLEQMTDGVTLLKIQSEGSLAFWTNAGQEATPRLLWMFDALNSKDGRSQLVRFGVDAATGDIRHSQVLSFDLARTVYTNSYTNRTTTPPPSDLLWTEGFPNAADAHASSMYNLVLHPIQTWYPGGHAFAYDSVGLVAHYATATSAFHIFGTDLKSYLFAGDQRALDDDAIAHEYGHGMFGRIGNQPSNFDLYNDWFAGNEFFGDASAVLTDIRRFGVRTASWQITNLRNWENPQSMGALFNDWYPSRVFANPLQPEYSNSTIYGHGVYLMIHGGLHRRHGTLTLGGTIPDIDVPAQSSLHIQKVLSHGLYLLALNNEQFSAQRYKARTIEAATANFGTASGVPHTVERAWTAVGIGSNCSAPPARPQLQALDRCPKWKLTWPAVPGATTYHGQRNPQHLGWLNPSTIIDGNMTQCTQQVSTYTQARVRACNGCGCSDWSNEVTMFKWPQCP